MRMTVVCPSLIGQTRERLLRMSDFQRAVGAIGRPNGTKAAVPEDRSMAEAVQSNSRNHAGNIEFGGTMMLLSAEDWKTSLFCGESLFKSRSCSGASSEVVSVRNQKEKRFGLYGRNKHLDLSSISGGRLKKLHGPEPAIGVAI